MRWADKTKTAIQDGNDCIPITHQWYQERILPKVAQGEVILDYVEPPQGKTADEKLIELIDARIAASK